MRQHGRVDGEVRRAVRERDAFLERGVRVEHRRRDLVVVAVDGLLERLEVGVRGAGLEEDLRGAAPDHHDAVDLVLVAETADVLADPFEHGPLLRAVLHVGTVEALHVLGIERGRHRPHRPQHVGHRLEVPARLEHAGANRRRVGVVGERVPRAEHEVVEGRERHRVTDERRAVVGALAEPDRAHLRERPDRLGHPPPRQLDACHQRARDRAEPDGEDAEAALGRRDGRGLGSCHVLPLVHFAHGPAGLPSLRPRCPSDVACSRSAGKLTVSAVTWFCGPATGADRRRRKPRDRPLAGT